MSTQNPPPRRPSNPGELTPQPRSQTPPDAEPAASAGQYATRRPPAALGNPPKPPDLPDEIAIRKPEPPRRVQRDAERVGRVSTALLIFVGTLLGSLIGAAADFSGAVETIERIQASFYPELCIVGSNTVLGEGITMAEDWKAAFEQIERVNVRIEGIGSVRGVQRAAEGGCVHVLAMSEPMTDQQYRTLIDGGVRIECGAEIGYDVIAFVTDINNPVATILLRDLPTILIGRVREWREIGGEDRPITIFARPGSGTTDIVLSNVARYSDPILGDDEYFPPNTNYVACATNGECLDQTLATRGSLYWVSTAWMRTQPEEYLRVIPILRGDERPVNPLTDDVQLSNYPRALIRPLYLYVLGGSRISTEGTALGRAFLSYVRSVKGQQILESHHFYTYFDASSGVDVSFPAGSGFELRPDGTRPPVCRDA